MQMFSYSCYFVVISAAKVILFFKKQILHQIFLLIFKNTFLMPDVKVFSYLCCIEIFHI